MHARGLCTGGVQVRAPRTDLHPEGLADPRHALADLAQPQQSQPGTLQLAAERLLPRPFVAQRVGLRYQEVPHPPPGSAPRSVPRPVRDGCWFRTRPHHQIADKKKTPLHEQRGFRGKNPGDDLLSHGLGHTTIGAAAFHFRVRDGIGWFHSANFTRETVGASPS